MQKDIFISYASADRNIATGICRYLENQGINCWIAPRDVPAGRPYAAEIVRAISGCRVLLLVYSSQSNKSEMVLRELETAASAKKRILPVRVQDVDPSEEMKFFVGREHWFNAHPGTLTDYLEDIAVAVRLLAPTDLRPHSHEVVAVPSRHTVEALEATPIPQAKIGQGLKRRPPKQVIVEKRSWGWMACSIGLMIVVPLAAWVGHVNGASGMDAAVATARETTREELQTTSLRLIQQAQSERDAARSELAFAKTAAEQHESKLREVEQSLATLREQHHQVAQVASQTEAAAGSREESFKQAADDAMQRALLAEERLNELQRRLAGTGPLASVPAASVRAVATSGEMRLTVTNALLDGDVFQLVGLLQNFSSKFRDIDLTGAEIQFGTRGSETQIALTSSPADRVCRLTIDDTMSPSENFVRVPAGGVHRLTLSATKSRRTPEVTAVLIRLRTRTGEIEYFLVDVPVSIKSAEIDAKK